MQVSTNNQPRQGFIWKFWFGVKKGMEVSHTISPSPITIDINFVFLGVTKLSSVFCALKV